MKNAHWNPPVTEELLGAFVGWLLIWRLILDQAEHDLSSRFGKASDQLARFRLARKMLMTPLPHTGWLKRCETLCNTGKCRPLTLNRNETLDHATGQPRTKVSYSFPAADLLNSPKCPATVKREFRDTPETKLDLTIIVDQAMTAIQPVLEAYSGHPIEVQSNYC